jgi:hypothetical protein
VSGGNRIRIFKKQRVPAHEPADEATGRVLDCCSVRPAFVPNAGGKPQITSPARSVASGGNANGAPTGSGSVTRAINV